VVGVTSSEGILDADGLACRNCRCDALYKEDKFNGAALVRYRQSCDQRLHAVNGVDNAAN